MELIGPQQVDADQRAPTGREAGHTPSVIRHIVSYVCVQLVPLGALALSSFAISHARNGSNAQPPSHVERPPR